MYLFKAFTARLLFTPSSGAKKPDEEEFLKTSRRKMQLLMILVLGSALGAVTCVTDQEFEVSQRAVGNHMKAWRENVWF